MHFFRTGRVLVRRRIYGSIRDIPIRLNYNLFSLEGEIVTGL